MGSVCPDQLCPNIPRNVREVEEGPQQTAWGDLSRCLVGNWEASKHNLHSTSWDIFCLLRSVSVTLGPTGSCVVVTSSSNSSSNNPLGQSHAAVWHYPGIFEGEHL